MVLVEGFEDSTELSNHIFWLGGWTSCCMASIVYVICILFCLDLLGLINLMRIWRFGRCLKGSDVYGTWGGTIRGYTTSSLSTS